MSQPLTMRQVLNELQGVVHNLHELHTGNEPFHGCVIEMLELVHREEPLGYWDIVILPTGSASAEAVRRTLAATVEEEGEVNETVRAGEA